MTVGAIVKQVEKTGWDSFWSAVDGTGQKKNVVVQAEATKESTGQKIESEQNDKVADALLVGKKYSGMVSLFLEWKIIRAMFLADQKSPVRSAYDAQRAQLLGKFVADIGRFWDEIEVAAKAELLFKSGDEGFMEWARRLDVAASLSSALLPAQNAASYSPDPTLQLQALDRLLQHLNQLSGFYTAKYIGHQYHTLGSDWLVPLVNEACSWVFHGKAVDPCIDPVSPWKDAYDPEDIRFRGSEIIVPMLRPTSSLSDDYYVDYCWDQAASLNGSLATSAEIVDKGLMGDEVATAKLQALLPATTNPRSEAAGKKPPRSGGEQPIAWDEVKVVVEGVHLSASFELAPNVGSGST